MAGDGIVITRVQGVTVAHLQAASILDLSAINEIGETLFRLVDEQACRKLIVDFQAVRFLSSQMIGVLISLHKKSAAIKGKVVLCGLRDDLMKVFRVARLDKVLRFADDESAGMHELI